MVHENLLPYVNALIMACERDLEGRYVIELPAITEIARELSENMAVTNAQ